MHDEEIPVTPPTSPTQKVDDGILRTPKQLAGALTMELNDDEIKKVAIIIAEVQGRYAMRPNTPTVLEQLRDEVLTKLSEIGVAASFDPTPCFYGEPPIVDIIGKVSGDAIHQYGYGHEKEEWLVKRANERKEDFYGQKGRSA